MIALPRGIFRQTEAEGPGVGVEAPPIAPPPGGWRGRVGTRREDVAAPGVAGWVNMRPEALKDAVFDGAVHRREKGGFRWEEAGRGDGSVE